MHVLSHVSRTYECILFMMLKKDMLQGFAPHKAPKCLAVAWVENEYEHEYDTEDDDNSLTVSR